MAKDKIIEAPSFKLAALDMGMQEFGELIKENMGAEGMDAFDLTRAINPTGKNTKYEIPGLEDEPEMVGSIEGIVVYHRLVRTYWQGEYKGGGTPPECVSMDAINGEGEPGGSCADCPFAKFGSAENNRQACRPIKQIFIIRSGELLPTLVNISAVNTRHPKKYFLDLISKRQLKYNKVITKITLEGDKSTSGFDYARTVFSLGSVLSPEQQEVAEQMTAIYKPLFEARPVTIDVTPEEILEPEQTGSTEQPW